jgi:hypothetical protein
MKVSDIKALEEFLLNAMDYRPNKKDLHYYIQCIRTSTERRQVWVTLTTWTNGGDGFVARLNDDNCWYFYTEEEHAKLLQEESKARAQAIKEMHELAAKQAKLDRIHKDHLGGLRTKNEEWNKRRLR